MNLATHGIIESRVTSAALLLDTYSGASVAFSLRKLRTAYTGNCIRVRRASDNAEQNIGFVGNDLDTASLLTFCAGTNGFVTTWYDQSSNVRNVSQLTAANQPEIVLSGSLILEGGKPAINCLGDMLINSNLAYTTNTVYLSAVAKSTGTGSVNVIASQNSSIVTGRSVILETRTASTSSVYFFNNGTGYSNTCAETLTLGTRYLFTNYSFSNNYYTAINGGAGNNVISGQSFIPVSSLGFSVLASPSNTNHFQGNVQEIVLWNSDQSANKTGIESNINSHYSIY